MKNPTRIASLSAALVAALVSTTVFAQADNCGTFYPKVPYSCDLVVEQILPVERADFSAFETGAVKATANHAQYRLRSVPRDIARKVRAHNSKLAG